MTLEGRFTHDGVTYLFADICRHVGNDRFSRMPYSARVLAENVLRHLGRPGFGDREIDWLADRATTDGQSAIALMIPRVILPDSSGVPALMDLAALRSAAARRHLPIEAVDTSVPVDLVVDHSLQVDVSGIAGADAENLARELKRNDERYRFLRWAQSAFASLRVFPPGSGIIHQVNIEQIATIVRTATQGGGTIAYPDMVVGGDSHTPMVAALGVVGWGVGGIEAETVMLGQAYILPVPEFVGVRLTGKLRPGITVTDLALTVTHRLRREGVVGTFVEYFGPAVSTMAVPDRATLSNMAPEYGATTGFWPVDRLTLDYLAMTGRPERQIALVEAYCRAAGLFREEGAGDPAYDRIVEVDLASVERSLAGPSKPYNLRRPESVPDSLKARLEERHKIEAAGRTGQIVMASITSCTNTANPHAMIRAGLVAKAAVEHGLAPPAWVKTSLAPGSRAVTRYLEEADLLAPLEAIGFQVVGYACASCGGKSGPLKPEAVALAQDGMPLVAVLSGNRNFDGRIHPMLDASYLCSPGLVVAYGLAGTLDIDIDKDPIAKGADGKDVYLRDLWPSDDAVDALVKKHVTPSAFLVGAAAAEESWKRLKAPETALYPWDPTSSYILEPPFFDRMPERLGGMDEIVGARVLALFGDGLTTDHVSPGGEILPESPAGIYLKGLGIERPDFNTYVGRRGNSEVMARATYANVRIQNRMVAEREGGWTRLHPEDEIVSIHEASETYRSRGTPLVVLAGSDFGVGSSRDWAAKGPALLGVRAVIARSFERIHRSNLIGLGIMPLLFADGEDPDTLGLDGDETLDLTGLQAAIRRGELAAVTARHADGHTTAFNVTIDIRSLAESELLLGDGMFKAALATLGHHREGAYP